MALLTDIPLATPRTAEQTRQRIDAHGLERSDGRVQIEAIEAIAKAAGVSARAVNAYFRGEAVEAGELDRVVREAGLFYLREQAVDAVKVAEEKG
jgi:hypothetical protein